MKRAVIVGLASGFRYIPALDGMRACAVLAVLLYHADVALVSGGFLGVELFFAVSGFLITSLLLSEQRAHGRIDLVGFWQRRARRLFPALWALLLAVSAYAALKLPEELVRLRGDIGGALFYFTNWQLILSQHSYFEQVGRPSLLQHLWSLAVEEQFYLLWPLAFALLLTKAKPQRVALMLSAAALLSVLWLHYLYDPGVDPSRVYYGSDTRAFGLLLGAALAFALEGRTLRLSAGMGSALASLGAFALALCFVTLDELTARVYPGGLLAVDLATCLLIVGSRVAASSLPVRVLASRPLVALGKRSYSLYLWHWPVFALTRPTLDVALSEPWLLTLRLLLTAVLAEASYRWVECPLREPGALRRLLSLFAAPKLRVWRAAGVLAVLTLLSLSTRALIAAQEPLREELTLSGPAHDTAYATAVPAPPTGAASANLDEQPLRPNVLAIGDSVMLGARKFLISPTARVEVDAAVGRTPLLTLSLLKKRAATLRELDVVIIHLGNNGPFQAEQFDQMVELLADVPRVVFVTAKVPRRLGIFNNRTIREGIERHPHIMLVDWFETAKDHADWFREDGLHLRESGATIYARLLAEHYLSR